MDNSRSMVEMHSSICEDIAGNSTNISPKPEAPGSSPGRRTKSAVISRRNGDKVLFSFARGRERCDRNGHAVFLRPRVDFATTGSEITGISTSSTKLK